MSKSLAAFLLLAAPASAGAAPAALSVSPPPGYAATEAKPGNGQAARYLVRRPTDTDTGCQVGYSPTSRNKRFTQAQLDAIMAGPDWQDAARNALSKGYDLQDTAIETVGGAKAFTVAGDFLDRPGLPARAKEVRTLFVIRETPAGRVSTVCVAARDDFAARRAEFLAVAAGAKSP